MRFGGVETPAGEDHLHGQGFADEARQALSPAGPRNRPQMDLCGVDGGVVEVVVVIVVVVSRMNRPRSAKKLGALTSS